MNVLKCSCCSSTILEVFKGLTPPTTDTRYVDRYPWTHIQKAPFKLLKWTCPKMEVAPNRPSSNYFEHWHWCWIPPLDCGRPDLLEDIYQSGESGVVARSRQGSQVISMSRAFTNLTPAIGSSGHTLPRTLAWSKECPQRNGRSTSVVTAIPMVYATWLAECEIATRDGHRSKDKSRHVRLVVEAPGDNTGTNCGTNCALNLAALAAFSTLGLTMTMKVFSSWLGWLVGHPKIKYFCGNASSLKSFISQLAHWLCWIPHV